jgi:hypothetical protein
VSRPVAPPSGWPPPTTATLAGKPISLLPLAEEIADRYFDEFPEDLSRYGDAARAWEVHDTLHCLNWAVLDVERAGSLEQEVAWLANVLRSRGFPLEHLARNLELTAGVVDQRLEESSTVMADGLRAAAASVRIS